MPERRGALTNTATDSASTSSLSVTEYLASATILTGAIFVLIYLLPPQILVLGGIVVSSTVAVYTLVFTFITFDKQLPRWLSSVPVWPVLFLPVLLCWLFVITFDITLPLFDVVLFAALVLSSCTYWAIVPTALYQHVAEQNRSTTVTEWPEITVLVPAYNEEGYVGPCIESFLAADYPGDKLNIVVVDDGSSDETYAEARAYETPVPADSEPSERRLDEARTALKKGDADGAVTVAVETLADGLDASADTADYQTVFRTLQTSVTESTASDSSLDQMQAQYERAAFHQDGVTTQTAESFIATAERLLRAQHPTDQPAGCSVTVLQKENGGKYSALNHGLAHSTAELVVPVDADSIIAPDALKELVLTYESNPGASAVAGNVKVRNTGSMVTNVQALEYVIGINTFRRALDQLGLVQVVPGCLGMFERERITDLGGYSGDTITEDFDLTLSILKDGGEIRHSSNARVETEVPDTWADLYKQRVRWFRGNAQTVRKHWNIFTDTGFGSLHMVMTPYFVCSMVLVPILSFVVLGGVAWMVLTGSLVKFLALLSLFVFLQSLFSALAVLIEDADLSLVWYAPLTVFGYKQFLDVLLVKGMLDVIRGSKFSWTHAQRVKQRESSEPSD